MKTTLSILSFLARACLVALVAALAVGGNTVLANSIVAGADDDED